MNRPELDPAELPEYLQREVDAIAAERRQAAFWRALIVLVWIAAIAIGLLALWNGE